MAGARAGKAELLRVPGPDGPLRVETDAVVPKDPGDQTTDPSTWEPYERVYAMQNQVLWDFTYRIEKDQDRLVNEFIDKLGKTH